MNSARPHSHRKTCVRITLGLVCLASTVLLPSPFAIGQTQTGKQTGKTYVVPEDFDLRLKKQKAKSGDVQVSLGWNNKNDLDLHVITPAGEHIFYGHRQSKCNGMLDVDMNVVYGSASSRPIENVFWPTGQAPAGRYKIYVNHYRNHGALDTRDPTYFTVRLLVHGKIKQFNGAVVWNNPSLRKVHVTDFIVPKDNVAGVNPDPNNQGLPKTLFEVKGTLDANSKKLGGAPYASYKGNLNAGETYQINMTSKFYDAYLLIRVGTEVVASDNDGGDGTNSRVVFTPTKTGIYEIVATTTNKNANGAFELNLIRVR